MNKLLNNTFTLLIVVGLFILPSSSYSQSKADKDFYKELNTSRTNIESAHFESAIATLDTLRGVACFQKKYEHLTEIHLLMARAYAKQKDEEEALAHFAQAFEFSKKTKDPILQLDAVFNLGEVFYTHKLYLSADKYFKIGDSLLFWANKSKYRKLLNSRLANTSFQLNNYNTALFYYSELLKYSHQYQNLDYEIEARNGMAHCYAELGDFHSTIQFKLSLVPIYKRLNQPKKRQAVYYQIAQYYIAAEDSDKAMEFCHLILNESTIDAFLQMKTLLLLSSLQIEKAVSYESQINRNLEKASILAQSLKKQGSVLEANYLQTVFVVKYKSKKLAKEALENLISRLDDQTDTELQMKIFQLAIRFYKQQNDYKKLSTYYDMYIAQQTKSAKLNQRKVEIDMSKLKMNQQVEYRFNCAIQKGTVRAFECL